MHLWQTVQQKIAGREIDRIAQESQEVARLLVRRDLELTTLNEQLERLNSAKGDFVSMAAHQLRTPITNVRWHSELLLSDREAEFTDVHKHYLSLIHTSAVHMAQLLDTLLYISQLELGTNTNHNSLFDIKDIVHHVFERFQGEIKAQSITTQINVASVDLFADPSLFDIVIQNLLSNAIKYTPSGGSVTVVAQRIEPREQFGTRSYTQTQLGLGIADTGYGIPEQAQPQIFNRLFRATNVQEKGIDGIGLGLYLVQLIVRKLGGEVWFVSSEDQGTSFYVTIPYALVSREKE